MPYGAGGKGPMAGYQETAQQAAQYDPWTPNPTQRAEQAVLYELALRSNTGTPEQRADALNMLNQRFQVAQKPSWMTQDWSGARPEQVRDLVLKMGPYQESWMASVGEDKAQALAIRRMTPEQAYESMVRRLPPGAGPRAAAAYAYAPRRERAGMETFFEAAPSVPSGMTTSQVEALAAQRAVRRERQQRQQPTTAPVLATARQAAETMAPWEGSPTPTVTAPIRAARAAVWQGQQED